MKNKLVAINKLGFIVEGSGGVGLKVQDLMDSKIIWEKIGVKVHDGTALSNSYFIDFNTENRGVPLQEHLVPTSLNNLNQILLSRYPGAVLAVRSSAFGERGGTGIYESKFFVPTGEIEEDLRRLGWAECQVYLSFYDAKAEMYRKKHSTEAGMGILIQPVIGQWFGNYFAPVLAGSAYSSYNGKPIIRVVPGLGTMAVDEDAPVYIGELPSPQDFKYEIGHIDMIHAIDKAGIVRRIEAPVELLRQIDAREVFHLLGSLITHKEAGRNIYCEWAISGRKGEEVKILQSAPFSKKEDSAVDIIGQKGKLIAEGSEVINSGSKECTRIIEVLPMYWSKEVKAFLTGFNLDNNGFLLVIPQEASSAFDRNLRIDYSQFCNANAVLENVFEPTTPGYGEFMHERGLTSVGHVGEAGKHFQQICDREDILFLGAHVKTVRIQTGLEPDEVPMPGVCVYNVTATAVNDAKAGKGRVYVNVKEKVQLPEYSMSRLDSITLKIRSIANRIEDNDELAVLFYKIHYSIMPDLGAFNPDESVIEEIGKDGLIKAIEVALSEGASYLTPELKTYLEHYREALKD